MGSAEADSEAVVSLDAEVERFVEEPEGEGVVVVRYAGVCDAFWGWEEAKMAATSFSS